MSENPNWNPGKYTFLRKLFLVPGTGSKCLFQTTISQKGSINQAKQMAVEPVSWAMPFMSLATNIKASEVKI